jgi:hypothetical protein
MEKGDVETESEGTDYMKIYNPHIDQVVLSQNMTNLDTVEKNLVRLPEIESSILGHLARSPSLYRATYPGFLLLWFNIYSLTALHSIL